MARASPTYVELQLTSHFSFLRGASSPEELFAAAATQGHRALGLADRGSVAGVVRGWDGQKATGVRMIPGARVDLTDGRALLLYPTDRAAWGRLTRLLSLGKARGGKGRSGMATKDEDIVTELFVTSTHTPVLFFSTLGKVYRYKVWRLPEGGPATRRRPARPPPHPSRPCASAWHRPPPTGARPCCATTCASSPSRCWACSAAKTWT